MRRPPLDVLITAVAAAAGAIELALGSPFGAHPVLPLLAFVLGLYSAGRHAGGRAAVSAAVLAAAAVAAARAALDPAVDAPPDAVATFAGALLPVLVGRWVRGQELLRRELAAKAERLRRERRRDAARAAAEERMRIAADLEVAVTGGLDRIARNAREVAGRLDAGHAGSARDTLARIADEGREVLADVRRVLGILRRTTQHEPPDPPAAPPPVRRGPAPPSWALPAALLAGAATELQLEAPGPAAALSAVLIAAPLLVRIQRPLVAAAGVLAAVGFQSLVLDPDAFPATSILAVVCAAYAIGAHARPAVAGLAAFAAGTALHAALVHPDAVAVALVGGTLVPWTAGRIRRGRRLLLREAQERAAQAEREREHHTRAAAAAERMRVARELHDAVAHNVSVVAIQAAGAHGLVERDPQRAAEVATLIEEVAGEALTELGRLAGEREPERPGLAGVDALARRARDGGLRVDLRVEGEPKPLPAGVDLAAFRIVQEALANASKHAGRATARVIVRYEPRAVELEIDDDGRGPNGSTPGPGQGHGLVGMRERAALYQGSLEAGRRPGGGFAVRARLPI